MILITGMPRAGTSFLHDIFAAWGGFMEPKVCARFTQGIEFATNEPLAVSGPLAQGVSDQELRQVIIEWQNQNAPFEGELLLKSPQLVFRLDDVWDLFSRVIFCYYPTRRWLASAIAHRGVWQIFEHRPSWFVSIEREVYGYRDPLFGLGEVWNTTTQRVAAKKRERGEWLALAMRAHGPHFVKLMAEFNLPC